MNDTYGKLKDLGMETQSVARLDAKGRIVIPILVRKKNTTGKYILSTFEDMIILRED